VSDSLSRAGAPLAPPGIGELAALARVVLALFTVDDPGVVLVTNAYGSIGDFKKTNG
jgi:hypothetical protein